MQVFELKSDVVTQHLVSMRDYGVARAVFRASVSLLSEQVMQRAVKAELNEFGAVKELPEGHGGSPEILIVPVLRGGIAMLSGALQVVPAAAVGMLGFYRDESTLMPIPYFHKLPVPSDTAVGLVLEPIVATGHKASAAVDRLKAYGYRHVKLVSLIVSSSGILWLQTQHPELTLYTCAIDPDVDTEGVLRPGVGDFGERFFGVT